MLKKDAFRRQDDPPPLGDVLHVAKIKATTKFTAVILAHRWQGFAVHWNGKRTVRCRTPKPQCQWCVAQCPTRWVGFLHLRNRSDSLEFALELTPFAGHQLKDLFERHATLRGMIIHVQRQRETEKAPIQIDFVGHVDAAEVLPPERSIEPTIQRLWGTL